MHRSRYDRQTAPPGQIPAIFISSGSPRGRIFIAHHGARTAALSACGSAAATATGSATATPLSSAQKLAMGTLNLEGTPNANDAASAAQLLRVWQLLDDLASSSSAAPQEISAVVEQIQLTMTAAQVKAISAMTIGQGEAGASPNAASSAGAPTNSCAQAALMGMGAGGPPPDAGGGAIPGAGARSLQSTASTKTSSVSAATALIQQVIKLLESKVRS